MNIITEAVAEISTRLVRATNYLELAKFEIPSERLNNKAAAIADASVKFHELTDMPNGGSCAVGTLYRFATIMENKMAEVAASPDHGAYSGYALARDYVRETVR